MATKHASLIGQDLRMNSVSMPTKDSQAPALATLKQSQRVAEGGAHAPTKGPSIKDLAPPTHSTKGDLPKLGAAMDERIAKDPLMVYLKKHAEETLTNIDMMMAPENKPAPRQKYPVGFDDGTADNTRKDRKDVLEEMFSNTSGVRAYGPDREKVGQP